MFPMDHLLTFSAYELRLLVCGEQTPQWTRDDILNYTEPKYGYTKDRYASFQYRGFNTSAITNNYYHELCS